MSSNDRICRYVDMPLQHASSRVLKLMRRGGSRASLTRLVEHIRSRIPEVTLRTTMMVGFPGETEDDFQELIAFCGEMEFDRLGVFEYSDEEDTAAYDMREKVPDSLAAGRRKQLMAQQSEIARRRNRRLMGSELPLLVEGPSEESEWLLQGRLESQAPEIDGVCLINDSEAGAIQAGEFRTVRITRALEHDLLGTIVK
jgi:ribosomal protein S12 methylthiotransferase